jgi:amino acid transporter
VIWVLLLVPLLAIVPLVLAIAGVGTLGWLVTYFAVLTGLAVAFRMNLREEPKQRDRR